MQMTMFNSHRYPTNATLPSKDASRRHLRAPTKSDQDRERIMAFIENRGLVGSTDYELERALNLEGSSLRPRRGELHKESRIKAAGTRLLPNGNKATVWVKAQ
jgi:hypothetical protein